MPKAWLHLSKVDDASCISVLQHASQAFALNNQMHAHCLCRFGLFVLSDSAENSVVF
jgi:hypothetical protein